MNDTTPQPADGSAPARPIPRLDDAAVLEALRNVKAFQEPSVASAGQITRRYKKAKSKLSAEALFDPPEEPAPLVPGALARVRRERSPEEYEAFLRRFWHTAHADEVAKLKDTHPHRIRVGWRIAREMARLKNLVGENELLIEGLPFEPDPWTQGTLYNRPSSAADIVSQKRYMLPLWRVVELIGGNPDNPTRGGMPLSPPKIDPDFRYKETGKIKEYYKPAEDHALLQWIEATRLIAEHYAIGLEVDARGAPVPQEEDRQGLAGMLDPLWARVAFPKPQEIHAFEAQIVQETMNKLAEGWRATSTWLREVYRLRDREVRGVMAVALTELRNTTHLDVEEKRALMEHRLDSFVERSQNALDLSNELKGLKVLSVIQGLTRTEPEDADKLFIEATNRVSSSGTRTLDAPSLNVIDVPIDGPVDIEVEPTP